MKTALVIPIYNRPEYVRRCFDSLRKLTTKPDYVVLVDDCSDDPLTQEILDNFGKYLHSIGVSHSTQFNDRNSGVKKSLKWGIEIAFENNCDLVINLDSDAIVKPNFITRLVALHKSSDNMICAGFNNPKEPVLSHGLHYAHKAHANGINMCFSYEQYEKHIKPALLGQGNWDFNTAGPFAITVPSCVQHIGIKSSMGHIGADRANDFKTLSLPDVTLFGIDSHDVKGIERAADISQKDIEFGAVNIITEDLFTRNGSHEQRRKDYSRFMLKELTEHFNTSHVLTIHADGYVVNADAWDNSWLQYDYIGASWWYKDGMNVGNGGFSLRSKKLCDILATQDIQANLMHPEDHCICRYYRESLEKDFGIKFAPEEVANKFSIEAYNTPAPDNKYSGQFGFHSMHVDFNGSDIPEDWRYRPILTRSQPIRQPMRKPVRR